MRTRKLSVLGLVAVCMVSARSYATEPARLWTTETGSTANARITKNPGIRVYMETVEPRRQLRVEYNQLCTADLGYLAERFPHTEKHMRPALQERARKLMEQLDYEGLVTIKKACPFMEPDLSAVMRKHLESGTQEYTLARLEEIVVSFPSAREGVAKILSLRLANPATQFVFNGKPQERTSLVPMGKMQPQSAAAMAIASVVIGGGGGDSTAARHSKFTFTELERIATSFPSIREVVEAQIARILQNPVHSEKLMVCHLERIVTSFPNTRENAETVLARRMQNPSAKITLEELQWIVRSFPVLEKNVETVLAREIQRTVIDRPSRDPKSKNRYDVAMLEHYVSSFPNLQKNIEAIIARDLHNTVNHFERGELERIATSFPGLREQAAAVLARDLQNPVKRFEFAELCEIVTSFPSLEKNAASILDRDLQNPAIEWSLEKTMKISHMFPSLRESVTRRAGREMERLAMDASLKDLQALAIQCPLLQGPVNDIVERNLESIAKRSTVEDLEDLAERSSERVARKVQAIIAERKKAPPGTEEPSDKSSAYENSQAGAKSHADRIDVTLYTPSPDGSGELIPVSGKVFVEAFRGKRSKRFPPLNVKDGRLQTPSLPPADRYRIEYGGRELKIEKEQIVQYQKARAVVLQRVNKES